MSASLPCVQPDGSVVIGGQRVQIPNIRLDAIIGEGANGFVFRGRNPYLERTVAVKLWIKLREKDDRDKFLQGVAEAKKTADASGDHIVRILDAGESGGYFYTLMEYFAGITLRQWLERCEPKLSVRWHLAQELMWDVCLTTTERTCHGDLHTNNVLVAASLHDRPVPGRRDFAPAFKIIDFGTSLFTTSDRSLKRHWSVVNDTFCRLLHPLDINRLASAPAPRDYTDCDAIHEWYAAFMRDVPSMMGTAGATWLRPISGEAPSFPGPVGDELKRLVSSGALPLDVVSIGGFKEWYI